MVSGVPVPAMLVVTAVRAMASMALVAMGGAKFGMAFPSRSCE
jgi:hypothetical protein